MKKLIIFILFGLLHTSSLVGQSIINTYSTGDIPSSFSTTAYDPSCTGALTTITITLPPIGQHTVTQIDIEYDFEAVGTGWMEDQRSQIHCQNTNITEAIFSGVGAGIGIFSYDRNGVTIANSTYESSTNLVFEMRAWRTYEDTPGCNTTVNRVNNDTWNIIVYYTSCTDCDGDGWEVPEDCDDNDSDVFPYNIETCDGKDNDCNGEIDEDDADLSHECWEDADGDGFPGTFLGYPCDCPSGFFPDPLPSEIDCNDQDPLIHPSATELCDGIDNNCNYEIDDNIDADGDGFYECNDCDDNDFDVNPGGIEICDGIDNNCNGEIDEDDADLSNECNLDLDGDSYYGTLLGYYCDCPPGSYAGSILPSEYDCDDDNPSVHPGAPELCDGIDNNCNYEIDEGMSNIPEISCNGIDEDCDGFDLVVDMDGDGYTCDVDCDDSDTMVNSGVLEDFTNGIDDNCDGYIDQVACYIDADGDGYGAGSPTFEIVFCITIGKVDNDLDCNDSDELINPDAIEICDNGIDENCDGIQDNIDADFDGYTCDVDCDDANSQISPGDPEIPANGIDDNCNGMIDETGIDTDGDGILNMNDNCPNISNLQQSDIDGDGIGDLCDTDFITLANVGIGISDPLTKLHISDGEVFIDKDNSGIIMKVDSNTCWRLTIDTDGNPITTRVDCPQ